MRVRAPRAAAHADAVPEDVVHVLPLVRNQVRGRRRPRGKLPRGHQRAARRMNERISGRLIKSRSEQHILNKNKRGNSLGDRPHEVM